MSDVHAPDVISVYHRMGTRIRIPHGTDVPERARAFVAEQLADDPMREHAARAIAEVAADLVTLGQYGGYQVDVVSMGDDTTSCSCTGVPGEGELEPPELDELSADGCWPGMSSGRLLAIAGCAVDDGVEIEFPIAEW